MEIYGFFSLLKSVPQIKRKYGNRVYLFQSQLNYSRLTIAAAIVVLLGILSLLFLRPQDAIIRAMYYVLSAGSLLLILLSLSLDRISSRKFFTRFKTVLFHGVVLFYIVWAGNFLHVAGSSIIGFTTYTAVIIAVPAVFSLGPLHALLLSLVSLVVVFSPFHIVQHAEAHFSVQLNLLLFILIILAWGIAFLHYLTTIEIFLMRDKLQQKEHKAELALAGGNLGYWNWDIKNERIEVDERWYSMLGYTQQKTSLSFADFFALIHPEDRTQLAENIQEYLAGDSDGYTQFFRMHTADGQWKWIYAEGQITTWTPDNRPLIMHGIHQDIQNNRNQHQKLIESESRFKAYTENSPVGIFIVQKYSFSYVNPGAVRITGYSEDELYTLKLTELVHPDEYKDIMHVIHNVVRKGKIEEEYVFRILGKAGQIRWVEIRISRLNAQDSTFLLSVVDITARKDAESRLKEYATYDELTGVYNRRVGLTMLQHELYQSKREAKPLSICFVDVNGLKKVNDTWGHDEGDQLIQSVAAMMREELRKGDLLCRLGGDEFFMMYRNCNYSNAVKIWERIEENFRELNSSSDKPYEVSVSRGILEYNSARHSDVHELLNQADKKMYVNKSRYHKRKRG